jgi:hypothetical protein
MLETSTSINVSTCRLTCERLIVAWIESIYFDDLVLRRCSAVSRLAAVPSRIDTSFAWILIVA